MLTSPHEEALTPPRRHLAAETHPSAPLPSCLTSYQAQDTHSLPWSPRPQGCDLWSLGASRAATLGLKHVPRLLVKAVLHT